LVKGGPKKRESIRDLLKRKQKDLTKYRKTRKKPRQRNKRKTLKRKLIKRLNVEINYGTKRKFLTLK